MSDILWLVTKSDKRKEEQMEGFGKKLTELRGDKTQEEVAKDIGIATSTLGMYETEKRVPRDSIKIKLAKYYKRSVQEIFLFNLSRNETKSGTLHVITILREAGGENMRFLVFVAAVLTLAIAGIAVWWIWNKAFISIKRRENAFDVEKEAYKKMKKKVKENKNE